ncbi:hypothetical protein TRIATDRAFT_212567 [Trichoderma atroviride IMI 206040]|uniref:RZ-type domain-containing protein n=1 Tax=Hypocrea atroviridis (strain ATCC 20476 / IMI 206040) TaxID=452589 RepID=G9NHH3_HYPAI|nr:uncharacterized protein TRIATDRAFT_212567 [Trichoderma atroviride IMI 206040]EHK50067.1 hypothetical protein TRIATDRAFT_212567 [Trichoderma atroviride IMI 206040]
MKSFGNSRNHAPEGKLVKWKQLLQRGDGSARPSLQIVGQFFSLALELMDGDVGAAQEAIKLIATETGLSFIKDVIDRHIFMASQLTAGPQLWETEIKPLFQLVTHARVVDSAVLETEVATILNYMVGVGGSRMNKLFQYIDSLFQLWQFNSTHVSLVEAAGLSLAVLAKMLDCNTTNIIKNDFSTFANSLSRPLEESAEPKDMVFRLQATKHLHYIRQRLQIGNHMSNLEVQSYSAVTQEIFVLARDLPGNLSAGGPRHDNDEADIVNIKVLPTYEEIMSPREEYLPVNDCSQWHIPGISGRLDREFRLIREDTVGQLRDAIRGALERIRSSNNKASHKTNNNSLRTYTYDSAKLINIRFEKNTGLDFVVRCDQPPPVPSLNPKQRRDWWERSKRLQVGALVCVIDGTDAIMFCTVSESTLRNQSDQKIRTEKKTANDSSTEPKLTLSDQEDYLYVNLQLIDATPDAVTQALHWYQAKGRSGYRYLVEFPGILLASFKHTLDALKEMRQKPYMPFIDLLAPTDIESTEARIQPPQYARAADFAFDLGCLTNDGTEFLVSPQHLPDPKIVKSRTSLDVTQASALLNTLSRELSLIQGPPGTGKSFTGEKIIKILLANKRKCTLGPILCVCYTNHALDQLLEHLLDDGISNIIRIGSRSKSERLQALNLRVVSQQGDRTKSEKRNLYTVGLELDNIAAGIEGSLRALSTSNSPNSLKKYLAQVFPGHHDTLFGFDEDGWETVDKPQTILRKWLEGGSRHSNRCRDIEILKETELFTMSYAERQALYQYWVTNSVASFVGTIARLQEKHAELIERRNRVRSDVDLRCLNQANIIGVTTTGLAKNLHLLRKLRSKVMLCEEAGEVLEAHILTALLPSIEHAILIGDHLQLRPQIQNYELQSTNPRGKQYSLDTSLFERLVEPPHLTDLRVPYSTLETQRRMHPSISELIRSTLYPSLQDGENVKNYPAVVGMKERLFWLHHDQLEAGAASHDPLNTSHSNDFEVEMTVSLLSHIVRQGEYAREDVAVITPYLGQLHKLRRRMESMFEICLNDRDLAELEDFENKDQIVPIALKKQPAKSTLLKSVRMATVDNFQGEEAKIIIISLVRSNQQKKCGFLSTSNRINVLLSRAKHGMYIIGNSDTYHNVPMWEEVINMLSAQNLVGKSLELQCSRHPDTPIQVSQPDHFVIFSPESGCFTAVTHVLEDVILIFFTVRLNVLSRAPGHKKAAAILVLEHVAMRAQTDATSSPSLCGETCPNERFCQQCATKDIKSLCVDFLEMKEYHEIDLDEEPCIFPDCGHFLTTSSMDGQMGMAAYYDVDMDGHPIRLGKASEPFSLDDSGTPVCATCRGQLRNIARYGRIVRRAMLDESTKKFIEWSHGQYLSLATRLLEEQEKLGQQQKTKTASSTVREGKLTQYAPRLRQLRELERITDNGRYHSIIDLWRKIGSYASDVRREEQPFQRVADFVLFANRQNKTHGEFRFDDSINQIKGSLLADTLLLKCDLAILFDFRSLAKEKALELTELKLDLSGHWTDSVRLIELSHKYVYSREEVQGHIFAVQLCVLCSSFGKITTMWAAHKQSIENLKEEALKHIQRARVLMEKYPSTAVFKDEIDRLEIMVSDGIYRPVTAEEMRSVYKAMSREFNGTGHWYVCENNHPFTIGECGMAMEVASCPDCGAKIGGRNHQAVEGTRYATEIENLARGMGGVRI